MGALVALSLSGVCADSSSDESPSTGSEESTDDEDSGASTRSACERRSCHKPKTGDTEATHCSATCFTIDANRSSSCPNGYTSKKECREAGTWWFFITSLFCGRWEWAECGEWGDEKARKMRKTLL